ncbi:MAG: hypothetical protein HQM12_10445 [SAR324 cluster bacterium]|nr:hypothetical protein [SAR324 cluster bacterium]
MTTPLLSHPPPCFLASLVSLTELRIWLKPALISSVQQKIIPVLYGTEILYSSPRETLLVPQSVYPVLQDFLEVYEERMAICTLDGKLAEAEAQQIALTQLKAMTSWKGGL